MRNSLGYRTGPYRDWHLVEIHFPLPDVIVLAEHFMAEWLVGDCAPE